eukprot:CAMPEP_0195284222 /NCGR_PEP_ID=MMETSP0707-20130614/2492_1 /TAXON_ID=33640 /ORGANISM="Asterionellopsis glacialis, Strain CCMP134" /LENGTH=512 /DNA_ID=CAMNT_0040343539 /DNA_START=3 /DNA_END=1541 /DNA_ORIENTATION=+
MAFSKRSFLILAAALVAIQHGPTAAAASSKLSARATFSPRSTVSKKTFDEVSPYEKLSKPNHEITIRGGAGAQSKSLVSAVALFALDAAFKKGFAMNGITFPHQLGGCMIMFAIMVLAQVVRPGVGDAIFDFLSPGSALLAVWLGVFFVPGLAMLPLAPSLGSPIEIAKILAIVIFGFIYSLASCGFAVLGLRIAMGQATTSESAPVTAATPTSAPPKPYSEQTLDFLVKGTVLMGAISIGSTKIGFEYARPLQTIYLLFATVASFVWGARLPSSITKIFHPLVTSTVASLAAMALTGKLTGSDYLEVLKTYRVGTLNPLKTGAGDLLMACLGPSVISFAISMYRVKTLLQENLLVVVVSMLLSSFGGLFGTALLARILSLGGNNGNILRLSMLTRNVTTALAMVVTEILGGNLAIAASVVVMTGILGGTAGRSVMDAMKIRDPVSRGLGMGSAAQGLGVAAMVVEKDAFPFAAIAMVMTAVCATIIASIDPLKDMLVALATGGSDILTEAV